MSSAVSFRENTVNRDVTTNLINRPKSLENVAVGASLKDEKQYLTSENYYINSPPTAAQKGVLSTPSMLAMTNSLSTGVSPRTRTSTLRSPSASFVSTEVPLAFSPHVAAALQRIVGQSVSLEQLHEIYCYTLPHTMPVIVGLKVDFKGDVTYEVQWLDHHGKLAAYGHRKLARKNDDALELEVETALCLPAHRGCGWATRVLEQEIAWLQKVSSHENARIALSASGVNQEHVGAYFWARCGFDFSTEDEKWTLLARLQIFIDLRIDAWVAAAAGAEQDKTTLKTQLEQAIESWVKEIKTPADLLRPITTPVPIIWNPEEPQWSLGKAFLCNSKDYAIWSGAFYVNRTDFVGHTTLAKYAPSQKATVDAKTLKDTAVTDSYKLLLTLTDWLSRETLSTIQTDILTRATSLPGMWAQLAMFEMVFKRGDHHRGTLELLDATFGYRCPSLILQGATLAYANTKLEQADLASKCVALWHKYEDIGGVLEWDKELAASGNDVERLIKLILATTVALPKDNASTKIGEKCHEFFRTLHKNEQQVILAKKLLTKVVSKCSVSGIVARRLLQQLDSETL